MVLNSRNWGLLLTLLLLLAACQTTPSAQLPTSVPTADISQLVLPPTAVAVTNTEDGRVPPTFTPKPALTIGPVATQQLFPTFTPWPTQDVASLATYSLSNPVTRQLRQLNPDTWPRANDTRLGLVVKHHPDLTVGSIGRSMTLGSNPDLPIFLEIRTFTTSNVNLPVPFDPADPTSLLSAMRREFPDYLKITNLTLTSTTPLNGYQAAHITFNASASLEAGTIDVDYYIAAISHQDRVLTIYGTTPGDGDPRFLTLLATHANLITLTPPKQTP